MGEPLVLERHVAVARRRPAQWTRPEHPGERGDDEQHDDFQRREWRAERVGWALMVLFVVAALAGVFGPGPLSWTTTSNRDVALEYQRFTHLEADDVITVKIVGSAVTSDSIDVEIAHEWFSAVDVAGISPDPADQVATDYGIRMTVATEPSADVTIDIAFRAREVGPLHAGVRFEGQVVPFRQLVYP
jgi:hypothetical protein